MNVAMYDGTDNSSKYNFLNEKGKYHYTQIQKYTRMMRWRRIRNSRRM
jgi:hypothetical protein